MLSPNFQLESFLNDKRMQEKYDWIYSMTILLEKITQCVESRERIVMIFEQLPNTLYLEGVYEEIRQLDPDTNQLRFKFIQLFLQISDTFLAMIPHSADGLTKIFERIELQLTKTQSESNV
jgi:Tfp pilus assembly protein PilO